MACSRIIISVLLINCIVSHMTSGTSALSDNDNPSSAKIVRKQNKYLAYIFNKYGSRGIITFEGLEHLMYNLGLGGLEFNPTHTIEEHRPDGFKLPKIIIEEDEEKIDNDKRVIKHSKEVITSSSSSKSDEDDNDSKDQISDESTDSEMKLKLMKSLIHGNDNDGGEESGDDEDRVSIRGKINSDEILATELYNNNKSKKDQNALKADKNKYLNDNDDDNDNDLKNDLWKGEFWQKISFKEMHDPKHRHPRHHDQGYSTKTCLSPMSIAKIILEDETKADRRKSKPFNYEIKDESDYQIHRNRRHITKHHDDNNSDDSSTEEENEEDILLSGLKITPSSFMNLCPALLVQIDEDACLSKHTNESEDSRKHSSFSLAWLYATICILIISMCGLVGVAIVPMMRSIAYNEILRFLVALAIGTLCGDALMHLLPHALAPHLDHGDDNLPSSSKKGKLSDEPVWLCSCAFMSALLMYILETGLPLINGDHGHTHGCDYDDFDEGKKKLKEKRATSGGEEMELDLDIVKTNHRHHHHDDNNKEIHVMLDDSKIDQKKLTPVAFMVILGDGLHNLTDGLAIGAAFASDPVTGMATALAVLCHELPHELGDFALLLKTGVSIKRALFLNVVSSILSFIGMVIGLVVAGMHTSMVRWIYAGTAGTFLYIALADLIPEIGKEKKSFKTVFIQIMGIFLGGLIMLFIALNEDRLRILFE